jgi:hypothetical protein
MSQNFHYIAYYIPYLGMEKGRVTLFISDYNVTRSEICGTNVTEFSLYSLFGDREGQYIAYLGMEKGGVTLSVRQSTSVSQTNGILWHECRRISIIHCILVTTMCHQWKSAARLSE